MALLGVDTLVGRVVCIGHELRLELGTQEEAALKQIAALVARSIDEKQS